MIKLFQKKRNIWYKVFDTREEAVHNLPEGALARILVNEKELCLAHLEDGFFAFDNKCPHQGAPLSSGKCLEGGVVQCAFHRYQFDIRTGRDLMGQDNDLQTYPVRLEKDGLCIQIDLS